MAGLNFQTQTIINSNLDPNSAKKNGQDVKLFDAAEGVLNIKRDFHFYADKPGYGKVCAIRKRAGKAATMCEASIDFSKIVSAITFGENEKKKYCRLDLYLGIEGNSQFIYSIQSPNEVLKGIPFWIEFTVKKGAAAADVAKAVASAIKSNHIFQCDKDLVEVEVSGSVITFKGATEYQRFRKIEISEFDETSDYADVIAVLGDEAISLDERGENSFGTYSQIVKDLRLLTADNYQPNHIRQVETPIIGAIYDQYIIEYVGPAVNDGLHFVGQRGETNTLHVFWVKNDVSAEFETALETAFADVEIEDVDDFLTEYKAKGEETVTD